MEKSGKAEIKKMIVGWFVRAIQANNHTFILQPCKQECLCFFISEETGLFGMEKYPVEHHAMVLDQLMEMSRSQWADLPDNPQTVYIQLVELEIHVSVTFLPIPQGKMVVLRIEKWKSTAKPA